MSLTFNFKVELSECNCEQTPQSQLLKIQLCHLAKISETIWCKYRNKLRKKWMQQRSYMSLFPSPIHNNISTNTYIISAANNIYDDNTDNPILVQLP